MSLTQTLRPFSGAQRRRTSTSSQPQSDLSRSSTSFGPAKICIRFLTRPASSSAMASNRPVMPFAASRTRSERRLALHPCSAQEGAEELVAARTAAEALRHEAALEGAVAVLQEEVPLLAAEAAEVEAHRLSAATRRTRICGHISSPTSRSKSCCRSSASSSQRSGARRTLARLATPTSAQPRRRAQCMSQLSAHSSG